MFSSKVFAMRRSQFQTATYMLFECLKSDVSQKNMLKVKDFIKTEFCHQRFDNNLQKFCQQNTLENDTKNILLIGTFMVRLCLCR